MDKKVLGLVLNWLGNSASSEDIDLVKQVIKEREVRDVPVVTTYLGMHFLGLDLTPLMREQIHKGNAHLILSHFVLNKGMEKIRVREVLRRYIEEYVST